VIFRICDPIVSKVYKNSGGTGAGAGSYEESDAHDDL